MEFWVPFFALVGAGVTALVNWLVTKHRASGKIKTSEAADLWAESQAIRKELRDERKELKDELASLRQQVSECHGESSELKARLALLEGGAK